MAYFSNGTEGINFDIQCSLCKYGDKPCPIALLQITYNYEQIGNDLARKMLNDLVNNSGDCAMFKEFEKDLRIPDDIYQSDWPKVETVLDQQKRDWVNENWERIQP